MFFKEPIVPNKTFHHLNWWVKHKHQFPNIGFVACEVMRLWGYKIKTKKIFNKVGIIIPLKCCHLEIKNLDNLVVIMKILAR
jgi:hypothetical protein